MSLSFAQNALYHPTAGHHGQRAQPVGMFGNTNGVGHDFNLHINNFQGLTTLYDNAKNANVGLVANQPITKQFAQRNDTRWNPVECSGYEQPVFCSGTGVRHVSNGEAENYIVSLFALNHYLAGDEGMRRYADDWSFEQFHSDWRFIGIQQSREGDDRLIMSTDCRVMTVKTGSRAHTADVTFAQSISAQNKQTANENDVIWYVPRKYLIKATGMIKTQVEIWVTTDRCKPPVEFYSGYIKTKDGRHRHWVSNPIRSGFVHIVHGDRTPSTRKTGVARKALAGSDGSSSERWKDLQSLPRIDIILGVNH